MSSCPGRDLEDYVMWMFDLVVEGKEDVNPSLQIAEAIGTTKTRRTHMTKEQFAPILLVFEPHREGIEDKLTDYNEEDHGSWRDYAGYAFDQWEEASNQATPLVHAYLDSLNKQEEPKVANSPFTIGMWSNDAQRAVSLTETIRWIENALKAGEHVGAGLTLTILVGAESEESPPPMKLETGNSTEELLKLVLTAARESRRTLLIGMRRRHEQMEEFLNGQATTWDNPHVGS